MLKTTLLAGAIALATISAASAQQPTCTDDNMMMMQAQLDKMTDPAMKDQKEMAMKEMMAAKKDMENKMMDSCSAHVGNAMKAMKMDDSMMKKG